MIDVKFNNQDFHPYFHIKQILEYKKHKPFVVNRDGRDFLIEKYEEEANLDKKLMILKFLTELLKKVDTHAFMSTPGTVSFSPLIIPYQETQQLRRGLLDFLKRILPISNLRIQFEIFSILKITMRRSRPWGVSQEIIESINHEWEEENDRIVQIFIDSFEYFPTIIKYLVDNDLSNDIERENIIHEELSRFIQEQIEMEHPLDYRLYQLIIESPDDLRDENSKEPLFNEMWIEFSENYDKDEKLEKFEGILNQFNLINLDSRYFYNISVCVRWFATFFVNHNNYYIGKLIKGDFPIITSHLVHFLYLQRERDEDLFFKTVDKILIGKNDMLKIQVSDCIQRLWSQLTKKDISIVKKLLKERDLVIKNHLLNLQLRLGEGKVFLYILKHFKCETNETELFKGYCRNIEEYAKSHKMRRNDINKIKKDFTRIKEIREYSCVKLMVRLFNLKPKKMLCTFNKRKLRSFKSENFRALSPMIEDAPEFEKLNNRDLLLKYLITRLKILIGLQWLFYKKYYQCVIHNGDNCYEKLPKRKFAYYTSSFIDYHAFLYSLFSNQGDTPYSRKQTLKFLTSPKLRHNIFAVKILKKISPHFLIQDTKWIELIVNSIKAKQENVQVYLLDNLSEIINNVLYHSFSSHGEVDGTHEFFQAEPP